jgi:alkylation response protein AidB-like acyl-CoA dehydrogenase
LFAVPQDTAGVSIEAVNLVDSRIAARIGLNGVRLSDAAVIGAVDGGEPALAAALDAGRACAAAEMVGIADAVFSQTTEYLKARKQFGKFIGEFQALQHRAAVLYFDIELARAATLGALQALDSGAADARRAVAVAKARAGTSATLAVQEGVQMHGGMGMTDAFDIGLYMKRVRTLSEYFGDSHYHGQQLALGRGY